MPPTRELAELARLHRVDTHYTTDLGRRVDTSPDTLRAVLAALGVDAATDGAVRAALAERRHTLAERLLPPSVVLRSGRPRADLTAPPGTELWVESEDGGAHRLASSARRRPSSRSAATPCTPRSAAAPRPCRC